MALPSYAAPPSVELCTLHIYIPLSADICIVLLGKVSVLSKDIAFFNETNVFKKKFYANNLN